MVAVAVEKPVVASVPKLWPGSTISVLATGPSLCQEDVDYCRGRAKVIAIKDAIRLAPWADVLYACGSDTGQWWNRYGEGLKNFAGIRYTLDSQAAKYATVLKNTGETGLETNPIGVRVGRNSGYQAIGIARHLGASRIVLLGYDMAGGDGGQDYFFGHKPWPVNPARFDIFLPNFDTLVEPLRAEGILVINASRASALNAFPRMTLAEALA